MFLFHNFIYRSVIFDLLLLALFANILQFAK
jgi:hypothetical protein